VDILRSATKFNTYEAVSTQMARLDFELSAIGLAGRGYVDVQCWCAHGRYDVTPPREARKVIFSLRLRRPLHRRLVVCGSDDYSVVGFLASRSDVDAVRVSGSARHAGHCCPRQVPLSTESALPCPTVTRRLLAEKFSWTGPSAWNSLPASERLNAFLDTFKLKTFMFAT